MKKSVILIFSILCTTVLYAENSGPAILAKGPVPHEGIEFLGVNAIQSQYGEYSYDKDKVIVYYTTEEIFFSEKWTSSDCSLFLTMQRDYKSNRRVVSYTDRRGWTAFFSFQIDSDYICSFIAVYRSRQNYFLNISRDKTVFSFPAILEF